MLISVPVLSDRLKFKQTLPWAPLPNSCQSNTTINKGIFPTSPQPRRFSASFFLLSSYSPWTSIQLISNRRCLKLCIHTCAYRIISHSTNTSHRILHWTFRTKCPIRQQGDLQTMHVRCAHSRLAPSYSLTSFPQRHSHLCEECHRARKTVLCLFQRIPFLLGNASATITSWLGYVISLPGKKNHYSILLACQEV